MANGGQQANFCRCVPDSRRLCDVLRVALSEASVADGLDAALIDALESCLCSR